MDVNHKKEILKNIGCYNLELQIINLASGYGSSTCHLPQFVEC